MAENNIFLIDKSRWKGRELQRFADEANAFTEAVLKNEEWDDFMRRASHQYDVIRAIWLDPEAPLGYSIGILKGANEAMRLANGKLNPLEKSKAMTFRLRDKHIATGTWMLYGDGQAKHPEAPHLLDMLADRRPMGSTH